MKIGVIGCAGRMGRTFIPVILANKNTTLAGGISLSGTPEIGQDIGNLIGSDPIGIKVTDNMEALIKDADAVIDFTFPETTIKVAELAAKHKTIHVTGTTGLTEEHKSVLQKYASQTPIIWSSNMSIGVNLLNALVEQVAAILDESFDIEIVEMHHRKKVDSPSGTALTLGEAAARGRNVALSDVARRTRDGITGERPYGEIGFATLRGGDVIGDHTVIYAGDGERIELTHKASNRVIYAKGAVRACLWAKDQKPGFYHMKDVLNIGNN